jgi:D-3-phosphoglycerate dehydrogenase
VIPRRIAVPARVFSAHPVLRAELRERFGEVTFNETGSTMGGRELAGFLAGHDAAIVALERIDGALLDAIPELEIISKYGVGLDTIDLDALAARGVRLGWTGGVNAPAVAELALALMLACLRGIVTSNLLVRSGSWQQFRGCLLSERTVGLVGCGHIGRELARILGCLGARVIAHDRRDLSDLRESLGVEPVGFDRLLETADIVSLHVPLTPATRGLFDAGALARMRPGAILINTARGGIVDEAALRSALAGGHLAAAGFDTFDPEPAADRDLLALPNFIATPHIGGSTAETALAMGRAAIEGLSTAGDPRTIVPEWAR